MGGLVSEKLKDDDTPSAPDPPTHNCDISWVEKVLPICRTEHHQECWDSEPVEECTPKQECWTETIEKCKSDFSVTCEESSEGFKKKEGRQVRDEMSADSSTSKRMKREPITKTLKMLKKSKLPFLPIFQKKPLKYKKYDGKDKIHGNKKGKRSTE